MKLTLIPGIGMISERDTTYCSVCKEVVVHSPDDPTDQSHCVCRGNGDCSCRCHVEVLIP